ncbi:MAG: hypothetical protein A2V67_09095 [Deltaproteobacteria bacterium RBG_13_61_14]|nr:MAG: hypothetical protein A2V67_09095 [Deltaproteobacteria bacterium RBG_13_61_14]
METSRWDQVLDYFPILAYFGFWLQGAVLGAILTGEPRLMKLGFVTAPAILAMLLAVVRIHHQHRKPANHPDSTGTV